MLGKVNWWSKDTGMGVIQDVEGKEWNFFDDMLDDEVKAKLKTGIIVQFAPNPSIAGSAAMSLHPAGDDEASKFSSDHKAMLKANESAQAQAALTEESDQSEAFEIFQKEFEEIAGALGAKFEQSNSWADGDTDVSFYAESIFIQKEDVAGTLAWLEKAPKVHEADYQHDESGNQVEYVYEGDVVDIDITVDKEKALILCDASIVFSENTTLDAIERQSQQMAKETLSFIKELKSAKAQESVTEVRTGPEEILFTPGDFSEFGSMDSIMREKMVYANLKHLGVHRGSREADVYKHMIHDVLDKVEGADQKVWQYHDTKKVD